jgi:hypothetical protein
LVEGIGNGNNSTGNSAQIQIFNTESSRDPKLGTQLRSRLENLANEFIELDDKEKIIKRDKKSLILEIADVFESLHEIGEYPLPISMIGSTMYTYLQRKGFNISDQYVRKVLHENAPHFLNDSYQNSNSSAIDIKIYQQEITEATERIANVKFSMLKREQIQNLVSKLEQSLQDTTDYAGEHNILIDRDEGVPHFDLEDTDPFKDQIFTDKPDPRGTPSNLAEATVLLGESIIDCGRTIKANGEMMRDYPPDEDDKELEINAVGRVNEWKQFWYLLSQALKAGTDRKYRRSIVQWMQIADTEADYGKHAASSKHPYMARFRDPKTGEWRQEIRKLTREQIGDKALRIREFTGFFKKTMPAFLDWVRWSEIYMFPYAAGLSTKLHDKLSDRSLR